MFWRKKKKTCLHTDDHDWSVVAFDDETYQTNGQAAYVYFERCDKCGAREVMALYRNGRSVRGQGLQGGIVKDRANWIRMALLPDTNHIRCVDEERKKWLAEYLADQIDNGKE